MKFPFKLHKAPTLKAPSIIQNTFEGIAPFVSIILLFAAMANAPDILTTNIAFVEPPPFKVNVPSKVAAALIW